MSVRVTIDIADGSAFRQLEINRITNLGVHGSPTQDICDMVSEYEVIRWGGGRPELARAKFSHRYGDDVLTLVTEAISSLKEGGIIA